MRKPRHDDEAMQSSIFRSLAALVATAGLATAATIDVGLSGTTSTDGWENLTATNYSGYGSFPGTGAWPAPIGSNTAGSGDAELNKSSGGGYLASEGIYSGGFSGTPNTSGANFLVSDSTIVSDIQTAVFQIEIGQAYGYDFYNNVLPTLSYNGGDQQITASYSKIISQYQNGTFEDPITGIDEPVYVTLYGLQWDLSSITTPITSLEITWTTVQHSVIYSMQLDQSNTFTQVVPEPSTYALIGLGLGALLFMRRIRRLA